MRRRALTLLTLVACVLALPACNSSDDSKGAKDSEGARAERKAPFGFFATVLPPEMINTSLTSDAALEEQFRLMVSSGVESLRVTLDWGGLEPRRGRYSLAHLDRIAAAASPRGIALLVNVTATPRWISERPRSKEYATYPPREPARYAELMRRLVRRYGPRGSLWTENPRLPANPIRRWQIWNEPSASWHWNRRPWAPSYTRLLKGAYRAIHRVDPGATVVAGSLVASQRGGPPWDSMKALYRAGAKRYFDVASVHPFTIDPKSVDATVRRTLEIVRRVRAEMSRQGDRRKPIVLTEVSWPGSVGKVPKGALLGLETTGRGQAQRLQAAYRELAAQRRKLGVSQAFWYTWSTPYDNAGPLKLVTFRYSGLVRQRDGSFSRTPLLASYAKLAAQYEGCRKGANARRCR
ncbi:MAG TPA: beta-galactosidase [Thermoleophilaceae bacterium]|nr:beta-galactosidase [Thermoleophilaceae bacterium]